MKAYKDERQEVFGTRESQKNEAYKIQKGPSGRAKEAKEANEAQNRHMTRERVIYHAK